MGLALGIATRGLAQRRTTANPAVMRNYATRMETPNGVIAGQLGGTSLIRFKNRVSFTQVQVCLPLFYVNQAANPISDTDIVGNVTLSCSLEYPKNSGTFYPFLFSGLATKTTTATAENGVLVSDVLTLPFTIPGDVEVGCRTFIQCAATGRIPTGTYAGGASYIEGAEYSTTTPVDKTQTGTITNAITNVYAPIAMLTNGTLNCVAVWGDSISFGQGDIQQGSGDGLVGWPARYLYRNAVGFVKLGCPSEKMNTASSTTWQRRLYAMGLCNPTHALLQGHTNDIVTGQVTTLAGLQTSTLNMMSLISGVRPGIKFIGATILPRTSSTDTWTTLNNQTAQTNFTPIGASLRETWNDHVRTKPMGFSDYIDAGLYSESSLNSGKWIVTGAANYATSDGTHPSQAMHTLIANMIPLGKIA